MRTFVVAMNYSNQHSSHKLTGYLLGILGAIAFGFNPIFAFPVRHDGMDVLSILLFRYLFAIPLLLIFLKIKGVPLGLSRRMNIKMLGVGAFMAVCSVLFYESFNYLSDGVASCQLFIYPLLVTLIMVGYYNEVITPVTLFGLLGTLLGVFMLCVPDSSPLMSLEGMGIVFVAALCDAIFFVGIYWLQRYHIASGTLTLWVAYSGVCVLGIILLCLGHLALPSRPSSWLFLALLGLVPTSISLYCTITAIDLIGPIGAGILGVFETVTSILMYRALAHRVITLTEWSGIVIIFVVVGVMIFRDNRRRIIVLMCRRLRGKK